MKILIVEDQLDVLECLRSYFTERGHEVQTACTAEEAIARLNGSPPDLAFIDLVLPRGHGRQVIQEMAKRGLPTRKVVITACDDLSLRRELLSSYGVGASDYLFKPIALCEIEALLAPSPAPPEDPPPEGNQP